MIRIGYIHFPWVLEAEGLTPSEKIVLACVTNYANNTTRETFVSVLRIAVECGYSEGSRRTVRRILQSLRAKGFISYQDQLPGKGTRQTKNTYTVNWPANYSPKTGGQETPGAYRPPGQEAPGAGSPGVKRPREGGQETPRGGSHSTTNKELNKELNRDLFTSEQSSEQKVTPAQPKTGRRATAAAADPISPGFYESEDRIILVETVQKFANWSNKGHDTTGLLEILEQDLASFFPNAELPDANALSKVWVPPKRCTGKYEAARWLNRFLHSWKKEVGELTWSGDQ